MKIYRNFIMGFTLVEVIIASFVFTIFITAVFTLFSSSTGSYNTGFWKSKSQKELQVFIETLRRTLEMVGYKQVARTRSIDMIENPIYINQLASGTLMNIWNLDNVTGILFYNVFTPSTRYSDTAINKRPGEWFCVLLEANTRRLMLNSYINPNLVPPQFMPRTPLDFGLEFIPARIDKIFPKIILEDVESLGIFIEPNGKSLSINITLSKANFRGNPSYTKIQQSTTIKLLDGATFNSI